MERDQVTANVTMLKKDAEEVIRLRGVNEALRQEADDWQTQFRNLELMVEPFREQIDLFQSEKATLLSQRQEDRDQVTKLSFENAKLLGHTNTKQKIHHMVKLKKENNELREKIQSLQLELEKQKKLVVRLQERQDGSLTRHSRKPRAANKENNDFPQACSTPLRAATRMNRI